MNWHVATALALVIVACVGRAHRQGLRRAWPAWHIALTGAREALLHWMRLNTSVYLRTLDGTLRIAREDHALGNVNQALHAISEADTLAVRHARQVRAWLERWSDVALALANLSPALPATTAPMHIPALRRLAAAQRLSQVVLPTTAMRFEASVRIQRLALKLVTWNSAVAMLRARRPTQLAAALDEFESTRADLVALDAQATTTFEQLLRSLPDSKLAR